ncbi:hypothetical protein G9A89_014958 [Geosiphon pyriformis]|nr:hypothetical protein G9A89_014958 [Geosiphon pyriformis]
MSNRENDFDSVDLFSSAVTSEDVVEFDDYNLEDDEFLGNSEQTAELNDERIIEDIDEEFDFDIEMNYGQETTKHLQVLETRVNKDELNEISLNQLSSSNPGEPHLEPDVAIARESYELNQPGLNFHAELISEHYDFLETFENEDQGIIEPLESNGPESQLDNEYHLEDDPLELATKNSDQNSKGQDEDLDRLLDLEFGPISEEGKGSVYEVDDDPLFEGELDLEYSNELSIEHSTSEKTLSDIPTQNTSVSLPAQDSQTKSSVAIISAIANPSSTKSDQLSEAQLRKKAVISARANSSKVGGGKITQVPEIVNPNIDAKEKSSKAIESEDGEISGLTSVEKYSSSPSSKVKKPQISLSKSTNNNHVPQNPQLNASMPYHASANNSQIFRGRVNRITNNFRNSNKNMGALGPSSGGMPFRPGFGLGMEMIPGMPMGQIPMSHSQMMHPMSDIRPIRPNIHINPRFAGNMPLHAFQFPPMMGQFPGPNEHMNVMPFQAQIDSFYQQPLPPIPTGPGSNKPYISRGNGFNHSSQRRPQHIQQSRPQPEPIVSPKAAKRKDPSDGHSQQEAPSFKRVPAPEKRSVAPATTSLASANTKDDSPVVLIDEKNNGDTRNSRENKADKNVALPKASSTTTTQNSQNLTMSTTASNSSSLPISSGHPKGSIKKSPRNAVAPYSLRSSATDSYTARDNATLSREITSSVPSSSNNSNNPKSFTKKEPTRLKLQNISHSVTQKELRKMADQFGGAVSLQIDRQDCTALIDFKNTDNAKLFRRMFNRSLLAGANIVVNFAA